MNSAANEHDLDKKADDAKVQPAANRRRRRGVSCWTGQSPLKVREGIDEFRCLERAIAATDGGLPEDAGLDQPSDGLTDRLLAASDERRGALDDR